MLLIFTACNKDDSVDPQQSGSGILKLSILLSVDIIEEDIGKKSLMNTDDFKVIIYTSAGDTVQVYVKVTDLPAEIDPQFLVRYRDGDRTILCVEYLVRNNRLLCRSPALGLLPGNQIVAGDVGESGDLDEGEVDRLIDKAPRTVGQRSRRIVRALDGTWIHPRTEGQSRYAQAMEKKGIVLAVGPAGTGKTYLAVAMAVSYMREGLFRKLVLVRPAVEA